MLKLPRAYAGPVCGGQFRASPDDFCVVEQLREPPSGEGEHTLVEIEKVSQNTVWVARWLARESGCAIRDIGYCGLKDRHARTRQWFSVPRKVDPDTLTAPDGVSVVQCHRHHRKLRTGSHASNHFTLRLDIESGAAEFLDRCARISRSGCPNWFGEQRFGRNGSNLVNAREWFEKGGRIKRDQKGFYLSAARSAVFNRYLSERVTAASWDTAQVGDILNLDGTGSVFQCLAVDDEISRRIGDLDLHPTGPLWGKGEAVRDSGIAERERDMLRDDEVLMDGLERAGLRSERRPLRMLPIDMAFQLDAAGASGTLQFGLPPGQFATAVLHEIGEFRDVSQRQ